MQGTLFLHGKSTRNEALDRVIVAQMKRDSNRAGTPECEEADREYDTAMALFRAVAREIR
jgi:hypothetical protein